MAKKATRASAKPTKNVAKKKQHIYGLNKVVRPEVHITDSSSFKTLVQRLTGNQAVVPSYEKEAVDHVLPVTAVECGSQPCSSISFVDSAEEACGQLLLSPSDQAVSPGYSDIESWLLGVEHELLNISIPEYHISAALMTELF